MFARHSRSNSPLAYREPQSCMSILWRSLLGSRSANVAYVTSAPDSAPARQNWVSPAVLPTLWYELATVTCPETNPAPWVIWSRPVNPVVTPLSYVGISTWPMFRRGWLDSYVG